MKISESATGTGTPDDHSGQIEAASRGSTPKRVQTRRGSAHQFRPRARRKPGTCGCVLGCWATGRRVHQTLGGEASPRASPGHRLTGRRLTRDAAAPSRVKPRASFAEASDEVRATRSAQLPAVSCPPPAHRRRAGAPGEAGRRRQMPAPATGDRDLVRLGTAAAAAGCSRCPIRRSGPDGEAVRLGRYGRAVAAAVRLLAKMADTPGRTVPSGWSSGARRLSAGTTGCTAPGSGPSGSRVSGPQGSAGGRRRSAAGCCGAVGGAEGPSGGDRRRVRQRGCLLRATATAWSKAAGASAGGPACPPAGPHPEAVQLGLAERSPLRADTARRSQEAAFVGMAGSIWLGDRPSPNATRVPPPAGCRPGSGAAGGRPRCGRHQGLAHSRTAGRSWTTTGRGRGGVTRWRTRGLGGSSPGTESAAGQHGRPYQRRKGAGRRPTP